MSKLLSGRFNALLLTSDQEVDLPGLMSIKSTCNKICMDDRYDKDVHQVFGKYADDLSKYINELMGVYFQQHTQEIVVANQRVAEAKDATAKAIREVDAIADAIRRINMLCTALDQVVALLH
jgi:predicted S18 family serine protease